MKFNHPTARERAHQLRRDQTDAEQRLWAKLRDRQLRGAKFRRQHPIGPFVADFCCPQRKLVVEMDGGQHAEDIAADEKRSRFLEAQGYRVLRFWNHDLLRNTDGVLERIAEVLGDPHPCPLPGRAREKERLLRKPRQRT
jgi:very-short-patch-repair endonuclease